MKPTVLLLLALSLIGLSACSETRFESPPGQNIERCDADLAGLWLDIDAKPGELDGFDIDAECRTQLLTRTEAGGPPQAIRVPVNFVHHRGKHYVVVADEALKGLVELPPIHGVNPVPKRSFFIVRYEIRGDRLRMFSVDDRAAARAILDSKLEGTISSTLDELHVYVRGTREQVLQGLDTPGLFERKPGSVLRRSDSTLEQALRETTR
ncbi:MAG: hypothetical protein IT475_02360 [Aquimonas sp.]|jgi:hypothetical protein|nr:hypothetical protein [Xanthomonadales bacterium]MCC6504270.1 hypothetical protein [Aquimonas sp.]